MENDSVPPARQIKFTLSLTPDQREVIERAAKNLNLSMSSYIRMRVLVAARADGGAP